MEQAERNVSIGGRRYAVAGSATDTYFEYAHEHAKSASAVQAAARAILPPDGVAIDVGANIGLTVLALAPLLPEGRILALEPGPKALAALHRTVALNELEPRVAVLGTALGQKPGRIRLHESAHSAGSHILTGAAMRFEGVDFVFVPITTLDLLVEEQGLTRVDFIKIDVEGFEEEVLLGGAATLERHRPACLVEFNAWVLQCNRAANPRRVLEAWLARFPAVHALRGKSPPERITAANALDFLHDHMVERGCADDLVLSFDDAWVSRWKASR